MANSTGVITLSTAGTGRTFSGLGFQPTKLKFTVGPSGGASAVFTQSIGAVDSSGTQWVISQFDNFGGQHTGNTSTSNCVWIQGHSGGWVNQLLASFNSFTSDGFKLDVTTANSNFQVFFEASN